MNSAEAQSGPQEPAKKARLRPEQVDALLAAVCGSDDSLRGQLEGKLRDATLTAAVPPSAVPPSAGATSALDLRHPQASELAFERLLAEEAAGSVIGRYTLVKKLGEGGMGTVYLAEQQEPVARQVALKIIKPGLDSREVLARFAAEQQALAMMEHPSIAKMLDGGLTPLGRPFFVMELVRGVPLTRFCDEGKLPIPERLALFVKVCEAVQHAHQRGVIHRDLKPSNVLVSSASAVKVIDFGVAKALNAKLTDETLNTEAGRILGTFEYMSPEQANLANPDVDTRSDVYSLGVILYELLAGSRPFTRKERPGADLVELLRIVREVEPPRPSQRFLDSPNQKELAEKRGSDQAGLKRALGAELDWIAMKALEKERDRRYATALELADDVERRLRDEPVRAGPPSASYRLRKFVRRHRGPAAAAALLLLALLAGAAGTTWGWLEALEKKREAMAARDAEKRERQNAEAERDRAKQAEAAEREQAELARAASSFLSNGLYNEADLLKNPTGQPLTMVQVLNHAAATAGASLGDRPLVEAEMRFALGEAYRYLGHYLPSRTQLERAAELLAKHRPAGHPSTARVRVALAQLALNEAKGRPECDAQIDAALAALRAAYPPDHFEPAAVLNNVGLVYLNLGRLERAAPLLEEALARRRRSEPGSPRLLASLSHLGMLRMAQKRWAEAEAAFAEAQAGWESGPGLENPSALRLLTNFAELRRQQGRHPEAEALYARVLEMRRRVLGAHHEETLATWNMLATCMMRQKRLEAAQAELEGLLAEARRSLGDSHGVTLSAANQLGVCCFERKRHHEAIAQFEFCLAHFPEAFGEGHPQRLTYLQNLLRNCEAANDWAKAERHYPELLRAYGLARDIAPERQAYWLARQGRCLLMLKRPEEAVAPLKEALAVREKAKPRSWELAEAQSLLGSAYLHQQNHAEAEPLLRAAVAGFEALGEAAPSALVAEACTGLAALCAKTNRMDEAKSWQAKAQAARRTKARQP